MDVTRGTSRCGAEARKFCPSELPARAKPNKANAKKERIIAQLMTLGGRRLA